MRSLVLGAQDWQVHIFDQPFPGKGQDAWALGKLSACLVDGATPLAEDWPQDIGDFARLAAQTMVRQSDSTERDICEVWAGTIRHLSDNFAPVGFKRTAGAAVVRSVGRDVTFSGLGDVMCLVQTVDGSVTVLDPTLPALDRAASLRGNTSEVLIANRRLANDTDGYPIVGDDPSVGSKAVTRVFAVDSLIRFWLMTDGVWRNLPGNADEAIAQLVLPEGSSRCNFLRDLDDDATMLAFTRG